MSKRASRKTPRQPTTNEKAIAAAAVYQLILLRDVIGIAVQVPERQLVEPRKPLWTLNSEEIQYLEAVRSQVAAALNKPAPGPVSQPEDAYTRHWANICEALNFNVEVSRTRPSPRLLRMLYLEVLTKHDRPFPPALTPSLLFVFAEALFRYDTAAIQKVTRRDRQELVGGLAQAFIDRGKNRTQAFKEVERLLGKAEAQTTRSRYRRFRGLLK